MFSLLLYLADQTEGVGLWLLEKNLNRPSQELNSPLSQTGRFTVSLWELLSDVLKWQISSGTSA